MGKMSELEMMVKELRGCEEKLIKKIHVMIIQRIIPPSSAALIL